MGSTPEKKHVELVEQVELNHVELVEQVGLGPVELSPIVEQSGADRGVEF